MTWILRNRRWNRSDITADFGRIVFRSYLAFQQNLPLELERSMKLQYRQLVEQLGWKRKLDPSDDDDYEPGWY